jgi:hypothetical protein
LIFSGKSVTIEEAALRNGLKLLRFNLSSHTGIDDILARVSIVSDESSKNMKLTLKLQPFAEAFVNGSWLLLDEFNLAPDSVLRCIEDALDTGTIYLSHPTDPYYPALERHPNFRLFATQNPNNGFFKGKREKLSQALLNRFTLVLFRELPEEEWLIIVRKQLEASKFGKLEIAAEVANILVSWHFQFIDAVNSTESPFPEKFAYSEISLRDITRLIDFIIYSYEENGGVWSSSEWRSCLASLIWRVYGARFQKEDAKSILKEWLYRILKISSPISLPDEYSKMIVELSPMQLKINDALARRLSGSSLLASSLMYDGNFSVYESIILNLIEKSTFSFSDYSFVQPMARIHVKVLSTVHDESFINIHGVCDLNDLVLHCSAQLDQPN